MIVVHHAIARPSGRGLVVAAFATLASVVPAVSHAGAGTIHAVALPAGVARGSSSDLSAVVALSRSDVWAVGGYTERRAGGARFLAEHWDGTKWSIINSPTPPGYDGSGSVFQAVDSVSDDDIWAVGTSASWNLAIAQAMVEHWDGTSWTQATITAPGQALGSSLTAVSFDGPDSGWAVGFHQFNRGRHVPLTEHWNGSSWSYLGSPKGVSTRLREAQRGRQSDPGQRMGGRNEDLEDQRQRAHRPLGRHQVERCDQPRYATQQRPRFGQCRRSR